MKEIKTWKPTRSLEDMWDELMPLICLTLSGARRIQNGMAGGLESGATHSREYAFPKAMLTTWGPSNSGNWRIPEQWINRRDGLILPNIKCLIPQTYRPIEGGSSLNRPSHCHLRPNIGSRPRPSQ
jgi:hypothetical protein